MARKGLLMATGGLAGAALLALGALCLGTGCSSLGYYAQAVGGHLQMVQAARPVAEVAADPATPAALREQLLLSQRLRDFAVAELKLPDNRSYRRYADLGRASAVFNVVAAPELSLALKTWCFAVVGCVGYRGYFGRESADALAAALRAQAWEASVYGVPAYSTLGRTDWLGGDPLLNTFIDWREADLARLIFHELAHQVAYADDDTGFNESYAVAVERIGVALWLQRQGPDEAARAQADSAVQEARRRDFRALTQRTRQRLQAVYAGPGADADKRLAKARVMAGFRDDYAALKAGPWAGYAGYDAWVARANNAAFAVQAAYDDLVGDFERLFEQQGRDFERFHADVKTLARLPKSERRSRLRHPNP
jgi:predicted aminopeptidase